MTRIVTGTGFECEIDENCMNDMELFDAIIELQDGDATQIPRILSKILPKETKKRLYDHCRRDGRVPIEAVTEELNSIFTGMNGAGKKS